MTNFAAIRLLAAFAVLLGHSFVLAGAEPPRLLGAPVHELAVRVFFVVSGYLVCGSWQRDPALVRFLWRRALRIMPALVAVVLLAVIAVGPAMTVLPWQAYWRDPQTAAYCWNLVLAPRFALPGVFEDGRAFTAVNGSLWSLPVEVAMYLLLPIYARRWMVPAVAVAAVVGAVAFTVVWPHQVQPVVWATSVPFGLRFAADFVVGASVRVWRLERWLSLQVAALGLGLVQLVSGSAWAAGVIGAVALPYGVLAFALAPGAVFGWLDRRADLSYGVYLWGGIVQQVVVSIVGVGVGWAAILGLAMPAVVGLAGLSWVLVEQPALRWKPGRGDARAVARHVSGAVQDRA